VLVDDKNLCISVSFSFFIFVVFFFNWILFFLCLLKWLVFAKISIFTAANLCLHIFLYIFLCFANSLSVFGDLSLELSHVTSCKIWFQKFQSLKWFWNWLLVGMSGFWMLQIVFDLCKSGVYLGVKFYSRFKKFYAKLFNGK
jgi:hypothetical protein